MKIRAAILGYGRSGAAMHGGALEKSDAFEVVAVCDVDAERRREASQRFGCATYDAHPEMLDKERLDLVCVITRSHQHAAMTCDCLAAGVHTLVTKPWALNEAEARAMMDAQQASGKLLIPWLPSRWGSVLRRLRELLAEDAIGEVFLVRRAETSFATRNDWQTEKRCGGGYLLNWGPHIVDPPLVLLGEPVRSVYGRMKQTINPGDVEDVFLAVLTLANGAIVTTEYTVAVDDLPNWFLQGTHGTIVVRGRHVKVCRHAPGRPDDPTAFATMKAGEDETTEETVEGALYGDTDEVYAQIAQAVRGEAAFPVTPDDALGLTRVLDAIRTASEEDRVVAL